MFLANPFTADIHMEDMHWNAAFSKGKYCDYYDNLSIYYIVLWDQEKQILKYDRTNLFWYDCWFTEFFCFGLIEFQLA